MESPKKKVKLRYTQYNPLYLVYFASLNKVVRIEMKGEQDRLKQLEKELQATKISLAEKTMVVDVYSRKTAGWELHWSLGLNKMPEEMHQWLA
jgi:hypothetical protein